MIRLTTHACRLALAAGAVWLVAAPARSAPVEYVRVCTAYGAGFFYAPGTDQCAQGNLFGYRQQTEYGTLTTNPGLNSIVYGKDAYAYGKFSTALGTGAWAGGDPNSDPSWVRSPGNPQLGSYARSSFFNAGTTAVGNSARAGAGARGQINATAVGQDATANAASATALGQGSVASGASSTALGQGAQATGANAVALGTGSIADEANTVSVGAFNAERRIVNVDAGRLSATSTDAVNGSQLYATNQQVAGLDSRVGTLETVLAQLGQATDADLSGLPAINPGRSVATIQSSTAALGNGSSASGANTVALGSGAQAMAPGASAIGAGAIATANGATASGFNAAATGTDSSAVGANAAASGARSTAIGNASSASGRGSVAIGSRANAAHDNSVAIGNGVTTSRDNQIAIGGSRNTYTLAGLGSNASRNAQNGPVRLVTSDASGNLAMSDLDIAGLSGIGSRMGDLEAAVGRLNRDMKRSFEGSAIAMSMAGTTLPGGKNFAVSANWGTFEGENGFSAGAIARIDDNILVQGGVGFGSRGTVGGRAGLIFAW